MRSFFAALAYGRLLPVERGSPGFAAYEFTVGDDMKSVEGRYWRLEYWLKEGVKNPGALATARNYSNALVATKGRKVYEAVDAGGGTATACMPLGDGRTLWVETRHQQQRGNLLADDNVGAPTANLTLSQQRAETVKKYLVDTHAISAARLTTAGFGDTKPVADNSTEEGRARNRRVELHRK